MALVIVERAFAAPETYAAVKAKGDQGAWCKQLYGIRFDGAYVAADERSMFCIYEAPDAECVRTVQRRTDMPFERVWSATFQRPSDPAAPDPGDAAMTDVIVERSFETSADMDALQAKEDAGLWCLDLHRVRFLHTYVSLDRKRMLCIYRAPDAESVRISQRQIDMPLDRVWSAQRHEPETC